MLVIKKSKELEQTKNITHSKALLQDAMEKYVNDILRLQQNIRNLNNEFILNGTKNWITNAPIADVFIILALSENLEKDSIKGFIIEKSFSGLSISLIENKASLKISPTGQIILDNVIVPLENLLPNPFSNFQI